MIVHANKHYRFLCCLGRQFVKVHWAKRKLCFFLMMGCLMLPKMGIGQETDARRPNLYALSAGDLSFERSLVESLTNQTTTTASLLEQFASEAPATIYVITKEQIRTRGYESLVDIMTDIPEIEIQHMANPEFKNHISLRGIAGNEKFLILLDGIRITPSTSDTYAVGMNFSVENAEQVEIILGPASALYGADAFSGIIQIITQTNSISNEGRLKVSYGMNRTSHNSLMIQRNTGDLQLSLQGTYFRSNNPDMPNAYPEDFAWYHDRFLPNGEVLISPFSDEVAVLDIPANQRKFRIPSTSYFVNARARIKDFEIGYTRHGDDYSSSLSTRPELGLYNPDARFAYSVESIDARYTYSSSDLKWFLQSTLSFNTYQVDPKTAFINTYTSYLPGFKHEFGKSRKIKEHFRYDFSPRLNLIAGFSFQEIDALALTGDLPKPFDKRVPANLQEQYYLGTDILDKDGNDLKIFQDFHYLHYQNVGSYLQIQSRPTANLAITGGLRFDSNTRYGQNFNPRLGIVWNPAKNLTWKFLYGESLLSPSPRKSNQHFGSFIPRSNDQGEIIGLNSLFFHLSNPELEPEKLRSWEASTRYVASNNLVLSVNAYFTQIDNLIDKFAQNTNITSFKGVDVGFVETGLNFGRAINYGATFRIDGAYNLDLFDINFYGSYSYSDGEINEEELLFSAKHTVKSGFEFIYGAFSISPRFLYRSRSYGVIRDPETGKRIGNDPFGILNAFVRYRVAQNDQFSARIFGRFNNLTDERYYNVFLGGAEGFPRVPQEPFTMTVGLEFNF